jgi:flagellar hook-basal body complex protein FliE
MIASSVITAGLEFGARLAPVGSRAVQEAGSGMLDFGATLKALGSSVSSSLANAEQTATAGILGKVGAREVVDAIMKAEQALQTGIALRDKTVAALQEVSRMSI